MYPNPCSDENPHFSILKVWNCLLKAATHSDRRPLFSNQHTPPPPTHMVLTPADRHNRLLLPCDPDSSAYCRERNKCPERGIVNALIGRLNKTMLLSPQPGHTAPNCTWRRERVMAAVDIVGILSLSCKPADGQFEEAQWDLTTSPDDEMSTHSFIYWSVSPSSLISVCM